LLKDITLGQYFPGKSLLHRLDPRMKIILIIVYITGVFLAKNIVSFAVILLFSAIMTAISQIPLKIVIKGLKPLIIIIAFTAIINVFWTTGETPLIEFYFIKIYIEGIIFGALMIIRITALLTGTSVILTYTTSPIALTDGIEQLLSPLKKIHVPVHEFAMMMTIALRFIPTLIEETDKIMNAQKARGADFTTGSLTRRAKALIPVLIPLFVSAFRRADDLAVAMECRCYHGGENRTRMTILHYSGKDFIFLSLFTLFIAVVVLINIYVPGFSI